MRLRVGIISLAAVVASGCGADRSTVTPDVFADPPAAVAAAPAGTNLGARAMHQPEVAALFPGGPMPTGVAVDHFGRVFVCFPRWGDPVAATVAEVKDGHVVPYPDDSITKLDLNHPADTLVSVQSVVTDGGGRLWMLDTGSIDFGPVVPGGAKLVAVNLKTNSVVKNIPIPPAVCLPTSYLNDVRFDLGRGDAGTAYLTDSSSTGPNAIIVVDLATGRCLRRLNDDPSAEPEPGFVATVEGRPFKAHVGADGITLSPDGHTLYYCPMSGHHLFSVSAYAASNPEASDETVARTVRDLGDKGFASDGLLCDARGNLYLTDCENNAIHVCRPDVLRRKVVRRSLPATGPSVPRTVTPNSVSANDEFTDADGNVIFGDAVVCSDARILWPDSMSIGVVAGGDPAAQYLYFTANQLERQKQYRGTDQRQRPFVLFRVPVDAGPSHPGAKMMTE